jgi:type IV conjugative transfer system protein TraE
MEYSTELANLKFLTKQRNIAFGVAGMMLAVNIMLVTGMMTMRKEIVMVPGIDQEYRIVGGKLSQSFLERHSRDVLSQLLDLTPETVMLKKEYVLRYTAASGIKEINAYFAEAQKQHQTYKFSTIYTPKDDWEIDTKNNEVITKGILTSRYGKAGYKDEEVQYKIIYEMKGNHPYLKSFKKVDRAHEKLEQEKQ